MVIVAGAVARAAGAPESACPHPRGSARAKLWRWGWRRYARRTGRRPRRETSHVKRSDRAAWSEVEVEVLRLTGGRVETATIAAVLGRSPQAVRCRLHRLKREEERSCPRSAASAATG